MIHQDLAKLDAEGKPIRVGVSGAGWIGSGFGAQVAHVKGMQVNVVADPDTAAARQAFQAIGMTPDELVETDHPSQAEDALRRGKFVVTGSYSLAAQLDSVDIVADVTATVRSTEIEYEQPKGFFEKNGFGNFTWPLFRTVV